MPSPAHASSAIACSVSSASHIRESSPCARCSSGISSCSRRTFHSSARRPGRKPCRSSTQRLHCRPASSTASDQLGKRAGGHSRPLLGDKANRYASDRSRRTLVTANKSGGHSRNRSVKGLPATACHVDSSVGSLVCEFLVCKFMMLPDLSCQALSLAGVVERRNPSAAYG